MIDLEKVIIEQPNNFDMNIPTGILDAEYAEKSDEYNIHSDEINNILSNKKKQLENWEDYVEKIRENFFIWCVALILFSMFYKLYYIYESFNLLLNII